MIASVREFMTTTGAPAPRVVLVCPAKAPKAREASFEPFLAERAVERLVEKYVDPGMKDLTYTAYHADETRPSEIVLEAQTLPFLAERRVVLVRNAERYMTESAGGPLIDYLERPCDTCLLILLSSLVDKRTKLYRAAEKNGLVVECPRLNDRELAAWIREETEARGKRVDRDAAEEIARRAGGALSDVHNAVTVVLGYVGERETIHEADVVAACADVAEEQVWTLTNAIAASQTGKALAALHNLCGFGKHEDELLGTINWLLKTAYALTSKGGGGATINEFVAKKTQPLADKLGARGVRWAFALCTDTQFMMRSTGVDARLALEMLVVKLASVRRSQGSDGTRTAAS